MVKKGDEVYGVALSDAVAGSGVTVRVLSDEEHAARLGLRLDVTPRQVCERLISWIENDYPDTEAWRQLMLISVEAKTALESDADEYEEATIAIEALHTTLSLMRQNAYKAAESTVKGTLDQLEDEDH